MNAFNKIKKARVLLILDQPFFASVLLKLESIESDKYDTMATDGFAIYYNADFVNILTMPELLGVVAHEVLHVTNKHHLRRNGRDNDQWNIACDYAINPILIDAGFTLPEGALIDAQYANKSAEQIYGMLPAPKPDDKGDESGQGGQAGDEGAKGRQPGEVLDAPLQGEPGHGEGLTEPGLVDVATIQAENNAKVAGKMPGGLDRMIDEIKHPKADAWDILDQFFSVAANNDYSFSKPNRRFIGTGQIFPGPDGLQFGDVIIAIDTSASINHEAVQKFAENVQGIFENYKPQGVTVIYCDSKIQRVDEYEQDNLDAFSLNVPRGGGTDFRPVFEHVDDNGLDPACLIYLTDLQGQAPELEPNYPVIWGTYGNADPAPWGDTVKID